jgi:DNA polymerase-3 subunit delta'
MSWNRLIGNREALGRLRTMAASGQVPGSLLLVGPEGAGKCTAAVVLAKAFNCARLAGDGEPCGGECGPCLRIDRGEHPDVRRLQPEGKGGQLRVDAVRELVREIPFRPFEGRRRFFVLDQADRMNESAANALLKSLEEPPPSSTLILVTAHEADLLSTVVSRCQRIRFVPLPIEEMVEVLERQHGLAAEEARLAAAVSRGSMKRALQIRADEMQALRSEACQLLEQLAVGMKRRDLFPLADSLARSSEKLEPLLMLMLGLTRDLAAVAAGEPARVLHVDLGPRLEALAARAPLAQWLEGYAKLEKALAALAVYSNKRVTLEELLLELDGDLRGVPAGSLAGAGRR